MEGTFAEVVQLSSHITPNSSHQTVIFGSSSVIVASVLFFLCAPLVHDFSFSPRDTSTSTSTTSHVPRFPVKFSVRTSSRTKRNEAVRFRFVLVAAGYLLLPTSGLTNLVLPSKVSFHLPVGVAVSVPKLICGWVACGFSLESAAQLC